MEKEMASGAEKRGKYAIRVGEDLYSRIQKYLNFVRHVQGKRLSKINWIREAIQEKLEKEKDLSPDLLSKERLLNFRLEQFIIEEIEKRVSLVKKFRYSFSKKKWFEEAFYEKLERDEHKARNLLEKVGDIQI